MAVEKNSPGTTPPSSLTERDLKERLREAETLVEVMRASRRHLYREIDELKIQAALKEREVELEARQNELYLAMRAVEEMPASEAQTACIVKLGERMRRLVDELGKSEVGRDLNA